MRAVVAHTAEPGTPERRLGETQTALKEVAILAVTPVLPRMISDLLGPQKMPMMASKAAEQAAEDAHRASTRGRGTVNQFVHHSESTLA